MKTKIQIKLNFPDLNEGNVKRKKLVDVLVCDFCQDVKRNHPSALRGRSARKTGGVLAWLH